MIEDLIMIPIFIGIIFYGNYCIKHSESYLEKSLIPLFKAFNIFCGIVIITGVLDLIYLFVK